MEDNDYISSDPWGLPVDAEPAGKEALPVAEEVVASPETADVDAGEPESSPEGIEAEVLDDFEAEADLSGEPAIGPDTEEELTEAATETDEAGTEPETEEEPAAIETDEAGTEPDLQGDAAAVTEPGVEDVQPISQAHSAARNVLDALGVGLSEEDLPEEPPAWMDEPAEAAATPPSVYQELSSLGDEATKTPVEDAIEDAIDEEAGEPDDLEEAIETAIDEEAGEPDDLEDAIETAIDEEAGEPDDLEEAIETAIDEEAGEPDDLEEAIEEAIDEPVDLSMEAAISAIATEPGEAVVDLEEPGELEDAIETTIDETVEEPSEVTDDFEDAIEDAIEEPVDLSMAAAISAIAAEPDEAVVDLEEPGELEDAIEDAIEEPVDLSMEAAISAIAAEPDEALVDLEEPDDIEPIDTAIEEPVDLSMEAAISAIAAEPDEALVDLEESGDLEDVIEEVADLTGAPSVVGAVGEPPDGSSVTWGAEWQDAAQGWVQQEGGRSTWRPIVTTTPGAGAWEIDTFLGLVAGDAMATETDLPSARNRAIRSMVDQALARGAHAVVGVRIEVSVGESTHVGAVGTAVTLKSPT